MRRWLSDPARRDGIWLQMCSTLARTLSADSSARISFSDIGVSSGRDADGWTSGSTLRGGERPPPRGTVIVDEAPATDKQPRRARWQATVRAWMIPKRPALLSGPRGLAALGAPERLGDLLRPTSTDPPQQTHLKRSPTALGGIVVPTKARHVILHVLHRRFTHGAP